MRSYLTGAKKIILRMTIDATLRLFDMSIASPRHAMLHIRDEYRMTMAMITVLIGA
jgi:hypothetical protein